MRRLIELDRRIVVFAENVGDQPAPPWYHDAFAWMQETPFLFRSPDALRCQANRGEPDAPFFLLNHWLTQNLPAPRDGETLNGREYIVDRVLECAGERGQPVNFIAVNFYEVGDLLAAVEELNRLE
jgi:hypothetical protein